MHTLTELQERQALPLKLKIAMTKTRIREWINRYGVDGVYVSFSGGKDSTVLLDIVRQDYPNVKAMFVDVPTQYPELRQFVKTFDNVDIVVPKANFFQVCEKYGFPFFSKEIADCIYSSRKYLKELELRKNDFVHRAKKKGRGERKLSEFEVGDFPSGIENAPIRVQQMFGKVQHKEKGKETNEYSQMYDKSDYLFMLDAPFEVSNRCCGVMKKEPAHNYGKKTGRVPMTAQMASESRLRTSQWLRQGCNAFDAKNPISNPMSFWTEQDVLLYIKEYIEPPLADAWENIYNPIRKKRKNARRALRRFGYRKTAICSVYGQVVSDDEEMGQMQLSDYEGMELFDLGRQPLHCTGCERTGCVLCGFGAHIQGSDRFVRLKETHPKMYQLLDVAQNNGYTMRQAIDWIAEHSNKVIKY